MYKCSMGRSCDSAVLTFFGHTYQVAFKFWSIFGSRGASALRLASDVGSQGIVVGAQHPYTWHSATSHG